MSAPPSGLRNEYFSIPSRQKHGLWVINFDDNIRKQLEECASVHPKEEVVKQNGGDVFYPAIGAPNSKPSIDAIVAIEYAYKRLGEGRDGFFQDLKASIISMDAWRFMVDTDPWFRPTKAERYGELLVYDEGLGLWVVPSNPEIQRKFPDLRDWKMEDRGKIEAAVGVYYEDRDLYLEAVGGVFHKKGIASFPMNQK